MYKRQVNARWLGGMLTNFRTMRTRIDRLAQLKKMEADGTFAMLPKKEVIKHQGEIAKLEKYLGGVKEMKKLPGALFIVCLLYTSGRAARHKSPACSPPHTARPTAPSWTRAGRPDPRRR